jgi:hypothetical protein
MSLARAATWTSDSLVVASVPTVVFAETSVRSEFDVFENLNKHEKVNPKFGLFVKAHGDAGRGWQERARACAKEKERERASEKDGDRASKRYRESTRESKRVSERASESERNRRRERKREIERA